MSTAAMSSPGDMAEVKVEIDHHESKPALTPPTSESTGKKDDDSDSGSDLSELEPEDSVEQPAPKAEEDDEDIVPDYYYEGGKVPVFKPVSGLCIFGELNMPFDMEQATKTYPDDEAIPEFQRFHTQD